MLSKLAVSSVAFAAALVVTGCGSSADAGSSASNAEVSQYVDAEGSAGGAGSADTEVSGGPAAAIAAIDPCALVTKEQIIAQIEASYQPDQLTAFKSQGGTWAITPTPEEQGIAKVCRYPFTGTVASGDVRHRSEFKVIVTDGAFVNPDVNKAKDRPIPGVGDEAYFMSRGSMMPYARVGKVAVGIEGFPSTPTEKAGVGLLRMAVVRVR